MLRRKFNNLHICQIWNAVKPLILSALKAKKNKGRENNILPPIARITAINKDSQTEIKILE